MYRQKLCLALMDCLRMSEPDQIRLFRETGFEGFFAGWTAGADMKALKKVADAEGMLFQSIHAPFTKMDAMWEADERTDSAVEELIACLRACAEAQVSIMVAHAFIGFDKHNPTALGVKNFGKVVREAEKLGVTVAFENTEGEEYLSALMEAFADSKVVGFCWDTGHEQCYNYGKDMTALYGNRLVCTHLNDNIGVRDFGGKIFWHDDLHLLPFDGVTDWQSVAQRLDSYGFDGPLTFELTTRSKPHRHENDVYARMDVREYISHAYIRACRVAALRGR